MPRKGIMLCYPFDEERIKKWGFPVYVQRKLDGDRCKAIYNPFARKITLVSSEGNEINSVPHIKQSLEKVLFNDPFPTVFDGELYVHGLKHNEIRSIVGRKTSLHPNYLSMEYHIFDILNNNCVFWERLMLLKLNKNRFYLTPCVQFVPYNVCNNMEEVYTYLSFYIKLGYEGFVVKNPLSLYEPKRSTNWLKYKPMKSDTYPIIGYNQEVDKDGFVKNSLGSVICSTQEGEEFSVGSGFTALQRNSYWTDKEYLIGKNIKVRYQELSKDRKVPRHPVVLEII